MNSVIATLLGVVLSCAQVPAKPQEVAIDVRVTTHEGKPVVGVGMCVMDMPKPPCCGVTDAAGQMTLRLRLDNPAISSVRLAFGSRGGPDADAVYRAISAFEESFATQRAYRVELPPGRSTASLSIVGLETIKLRATSPLAKNGNAPELLLSRLDGGSIAESKNGTCTLELHGLPRNRDSEIELMSCDGLIEVRQVPAAQAASDVDWGAIFLKVTNATIPVTLTVRSPKELPSDFGLYMYEHRLVRNDRSVAFEGVAPPGEHLQSRMSMTLDEKPKLPPGEYYVGAGPFWTSWINEQLWSTLKKPNAEQILRDARWPKITVPEKGEVKAEVALEDIVAAARKVRGF